MNKKPYAEMALTEILLLEENRRIFYLLGLEAQNQLIGDLLRSDDHLSSEISSTDD